MMVQGSSRRFVLSLLLAIIAAVAIRTAVVIPDACSWLDPGSWLYHVLGCDGGEAGGGGGSGAGD